MQCDKDSIFIAADQHGTVLSSVPKIPTDAYFVQFREKRDYDG
jgi:hypothetical protein